jgi:hypothetical protein
MGREKEKKTKRKREREKIFIFVVMFLKYKEYSEENFMHIVQRPTAIFIS